MASTGMEGEVHGKSGSVALPRVKVVMRPARAGLEMPALAAERRAEVRRSVVFMVYGCNGCCGFNCRF